jgi:dTDP-4-dehydrorhamnose 3,5-epimerase
MRFEPLSLPGAHKLVLEPYVDSRGSFARTFCAREFASAGLPGHFVQASLSRTNARGTVRGLHFQWPPSSEAKIVRCVSGAVHDVLLDLRPESSTFLEHLTVTLAADHGDAVYIPHGVAHGFQTLRDATDVLYLMTDFYEADLAGGVRWNDPAFGVAWPIAEASEISERDRDCPDFDRATFVAEWRRRQGAS